MRFKIIFMILVLNKFNLVSSQNLHMFVSVNATLPSIVYADDWNPNQYGPEDNYIEKMGFGRGINFNVGARDSKFEFGLSFDQFLIVKEDFPPPKSVSKYRYTRVNFVTLAPFFSLT